MSVDFSTQLTAVATLALAALALALALALATAVLAGFALRKQAKEVSTLLEQNRHGTEERHR
jgi:predicted lipoprotein with Yx(FWY)xxD motif